MASKSKSLVKYGMTQQQAADELGVSQQTISVDLTLPENIGIPQKTGKPKRIQYTMTQYTSAESVAPKILEKFGDVFADNLKELL